MADKKRHINYPAMAALLLTIPLINIAAAILLSKLLQHSLAGFSVTLAILSLACIGVGISLLAGSNRHTAGWAMIWGGFITLLGWIFLPYGISLLYLA